MFQKIGIHTYIIINASNERIHVDFERKNKNNSSFLTFKLGESIKSFMTDLLNIIFDDFSI